VPSGSSLSKLAKDGRPDGPPPALLLPPLPANSRNAQYSWAGIFSEELSTNQQTLGFFKTQETLGKSTCRLAAATPSRNCVIRIPAIK
jgi:hypothetical protein